MNIRKSWLYRRARRMRPLGDRRKKDARKLHEKQRAKKYGSIPGLQF
jgi:hypothetical protein